MSTRSERFADLVNNAMGRCDGDPEAAADALTEDEVAEMFELLSHVTKVGTTPLPDGRGLGLLLHFDESARP